MLAVFLEPGQKPTPVASYQEASQVVQAFVTRRGWGASDYYAWSRRGCIVQQGPSGEKTIVATISYNGRVWDAEEKTLLEEAAPRP